MNSNSSLIKKVLNKSLWDLPSSSNMNYFWNFGSMLGVCLMVQIMTGLFLTFYYTSFSEHSFNSVMFIMKETWNGWLIRFIHMNGASMFFIFIYMHLFRGLFYFSAKNKKNWISGILILMIVMMISFLGYVLPWGQMSYWAVAVITNLFSVIPMIGENLVTWIWGSFSVDYPTLSRFYTLHFVTPMILTVLILIHLMFIHESGSSNSLSMESNMDKIHFNPYFTIKDILFIVMSLMGMFILVIANPYLTLDPVNNVISNPMSTPLHIKPEWYFLVSYAILRCLPNKTMGVMALLMSVTFYLTNLMFVMKFSSKFSFIRMSFYWVLISSFFMLMMMGSLPAEEPYILTSKLWTSIFFTSMIFMNM